MKNHYIPRYYLHGFTDNSGGIWTYRKDRFQPFQTGVLGTGFERDFYSDETEIRLNELVEIPANPIIDKIRAFEHITRSEKDIFAAYVLNILVRAFFGKTIIDQRYDTVLKEVFAQENLYKLFPSGAPQIKDIVALIRLHHEWSDKKREQVISGLWDSLLLPSSYPNSSLVLSRMTWQFLVFKSEPAFVTSDNPVYFPSNMGLGHPNVEVTFPISQHIALWATWRNVPETFVPVSQSIVTEINRRTVSRKAFSIFAPTNKSWVTELANESQYNPKQIETISGSTHYLLLSKP